MVKKVGRPGMSVAEHEKLATRVLAPYKLRKPCLIAHNSKEGEPSSVARRVYIKRHGEPPFGLFVCHHCDRHSCIEDSHHFLGTQQDNLKDCVAKGRMQRSEAHRAALAASNHLRKGQPQSPAGQAALLKARATLRDKHDRNQRNLRTFAFGFQP